MKKSIQQLFGLLTLILVVTSLSCNLLQIAAGNTPNPPAEQTVAALASSQPASPSPTSAPTKAPLPMATSAPTNSPESQAYFDGITFSYDPSLSKGVLGQVLEASAPASDQMPLFAINPKMDQFNFQGYPVSQDLKPQIQIFSISDYEKLAGDPIVSQTVEALKKLMADHPADSSGELPFLPIGNAGQLMHAQLKYIKFQNGKGIRYLAEFGQNYAPLSNKLLFYTFQGITSDGAYYVSAVLPINHAKLPGDDGETLAVQDFQKFSDNFPSYVVDIQNKLNSEKGSSFTPSLVLLDDMINSLKVAK